MLTDSALPLVSLLVPVYGVEKYIERCARSLFEQKYSNLEFIFVDDASPDKSIEILQQVAAEYPKWEGRVSIIHHDRNRGLAAARNTLVDHCKGEFLIHADSDDWLERNAVELLVSRQLETGADIVSGLFQRHTFTSDNEEALKRVTRLKERDREETLKAMVKFGSIVAIWNRLIRRSLYCDNHIRSVEGIDAGEDLLVTPRLVYYSRKVASCNRVTYHYDQRNPHSFAIVFPHNWDMQIQLIRATQSNVAFFKDKESFLKEAMEEHLVKRLDYEIKLTFDNHNRRGYRTVLALLDDTPRKYWPLVGWDRPHKRWLDHHYHLKRISMFFSGKEV